MIDIEQIVSDASSNPPFKVHVFKEPLSYAKAREIQQEAHKFVLNSEDILGIIFLLEHSPVITIGKHGNEQYLKATSEYLAANEVCVHRSDRGGEITAHMPGQLVAYPVLHLSKLKLGPKKYVQILQDCVIGVCEQFGVVAAASAEHPGVWVDNRKIASVGVRVSKRVSIHGIAFNVCNDLSLFSKMVPCGIKDRKMTSLLTESKKGNSPEYFNVVRDCFIETLLSLFKKISS